MAEKLSDAHNGAEKIQLALLGSIPAWATFQLLNDLILTGRKLLMAGLRLQFPDASDEELRRRLATLFLGPELAVKVYGPEPLPPTLR